MCQQAVIALDVGGTTIDAACVSATGDLIGEPRETGSPAAGTRDEIVDGLARAIDAARARGARAARAAAADGLAGTAGAGFAVTACGIAMPAPFDYAAGVSHMEHKFAAIRGVDLGGFLRAKTGLPAYFVNDASAFGLGVSWRQLPDTKRFVALTIGTGLGGGFIENGESVEDDPRVPPGGEIWDLPFREGILEDYVSAHGVSALYAGLAPGEPRSATSEPRSPREVSELAREGSQPAIDAYRAMGTALGQGLAPVFARFAPEKVVIGGHVGQSLELFGPAMGRALAAEGCQDLPVLAAAPGNLAIWGAARYTLARAAAAGR